MARVLSMTDCLFCKFVREELVPDVVAESEHSLAFRDISPKAPMHVLVVPRRHVENVAALAEAAPDELADVIALARSVARQEGHEDYRLIANTGAGAGQTIFHAHCHVLGGWAGEPPSE